MRYYFSIILSIMLIGCNCGNTDADADGNTICKEHRMIYNECDHPQHKLFITKSNEYLCVCPGSLITKYETQPSELKVGE